MIFAVLHVWQLSSLTLRFKTGKFFYTNICGFYNKWFFLVVSGRFRREMTSPIVFPTPISYWGSSRVLCPSVIVRKCFRTHYAEYAISVATGSPETGNDVSNQLSDPHLLFVVWHVQMTSTAYFSIVLADDNQLYFCTSKLYKLLDQIWINWIE